MEGGITVLDYSQIDATVLYLMLSMNFSSCVTCECCARMVPRQAESMGSMLLLV